MKGFTRNCYILNILAVDLIVSEDFQSFSQKSMGPLCFPLPDGSLHEISSILAN